MIVESTDNDALIDKLFCKQRNFFRQNCDFGHIQGDSVLIERFEHDFFHADSPARSSLNRDTQIPFDADRTDTVVQCAAPHLKYVQIAGKANENFASLNLHF